MRSRRADIARRRSRGSRFEISVFVMSRNSLRRSPSRRRSPPDCAYCFGEFSDDSVKVIYGFSPHECAVALVKHSVPLSAFTSSEYFISIVVAYKVSWTRAEVVRLRPFEYKASNYPLDIERNIRRVGVTVGHICRRMI